MNRQLPILNLVAYTGLVIVNYLAVQVPFFGKTPGDVSDLFPNPFTPADFAFHIWSVIYMLLGIYIYFQSKPIFQKQKMIPEEVTLIGHLFIATCVLNFGWLLAWQSMHIGWSFVLIFVLWILLILISHRLTMYRKGHWGFTIPFSVYLSWVSVAALANLNVWLIDLGFGFFGLAPENWAAALVVLGIFGGLLVFYLNKDYFFLLVLAWAYFGIYMKNSSVDQCLASAALVGISAVLIMCIWSWVEKRRTGKPHLNT